ncbi:kinase-like protein [Aaosphaeria arxii CBS 175.79]|uniref:Kinase-like protein n=1 Tax=Aaosphaeria arxii CBS 175.79 TaxID=1450172 RepID=A0A6A5XRN8_9PLEO|nr:kinase-like protein [Aaosphaeria arxii CBS 175.79]KAF2015569.1 kinase-like protein [Aaosphaeria arxii CBS 175.79]
MASKVLDIREGQDVYVEEDEKLPYRLVRNLGHGHSANVEMVEDIYTGRVFARKLFRIHRTRDQRKAIFDNEIKIIRRLKNHRHIIRVFATYVAKKEVGLILSPVADGGDLESFLNDFAVGQIARKGTTERRLVRKSFGCLAAGLAFMHQQKIRHKDIKPRNILIHRGTMIYTDFGYSFDYSLPDGRSTTTGRPDTFTRKYCAPEVVDWEPRNSKSDVFSLGCVFLEMLAVLDARATLPHCDQPYSAVGEAIQCLFETLEERHSRKNVGSRTTVTRLWSVIYKMLSFDPTQRPTASFITTHIRKQSPTHFFCKDCSDESGNLDPKPSNGDRRNLKIVKSNRTTSARPQNLRQASTDSTQSKEYTCCDSTMKLVVAREDAAIANYGSMSIA